VGYVIKELLGAGLAHADILTVAENGMADFATEPFWTARRCLSAPPPTASGTTMLRPVGAVPARWRHASGPGQPGPRHLQEQRGGQGTLDHRSPDPVFDTQEGVQPRSRRASWKGRHRRRPLPGPRANGMPELHKLTPPLGVLQDKGFKVALVTDGRMSGASARCPPPSMSRPRRWPMRGSVRPAGLSARWRHRARLRRNGALEI
jgi:phosphogluconate dehydratase